MLDKSQYSIGIDLGTTHCVLSYLDLQMADEAAKTDAIKQEVLFIPQLTAPGSIDERLQLPSFIYQFHESEVASGDLALPWNGAPNQLVGELARKMGSKTPIRLISSAKSWLCHAGVDRRSAFLPLESPEEVEKISPFEATIAYLEHLKSSWNHSNSDNPIENQQLIITVPASFDPAARELTAEAARATGFQHLTLLEEPQAAVYSWIHQAGKTWREQVMVGDIILVVDIGGGTTDLSLIAVTEDEGNLTLNRIAVGDHILLGGDNMDLALAYRIKARLAQQGKKLQAWQVIALTHGCRDAKETLLADPGVDSVPLVVPSRGSRLMGGTLRAELTRQDIEQTLIEGFFPQVSVDEHPVHNPRAALTKLGLPYAQDAAVTRHLAAFLSKQVDAMDDVEGFEGASGSFIKPSAILLNGGVLKAPILANKVLNIINDWLSSDGAAAARLLEGADLDLAVAKGAAYYGYVRQGKGVRIRGGIANAYYIGVESSMPAVPGMEPPIQALCVAPFGMEEGTDVMIDNEEFGLIVGEPVRFRFYGSATRREDQPGEILEDWNDGELEELPEIQATLPIEGRTKGEIVPVHLAATVTEVGTIRLEALPVNGAERWNVELDVRDS
ncbi:MAG: Hsp70 family protein [gamma proteobacterium symbiont of Taylorina sp.]|nr:Hsp70 family protein [gamma proteobacterium symbiont of Taylorina sp.]